MIGLFETFQINLIKLAKKLKTKVNAGLLRLAVTWSSARIAKYDYDENLNK